MLQRLNDTLKDSFLKVAGILDIPLNNLAIVWDL